MKKFTEVFWAPWRDTCNAEDLWVDTMYLPPTPLMGVAHNTIEDAQGHLFQCPSVKGIIKNDFIIKAPLDLTLTFSENNTINTDRYGQNFYDKAINNRSTPNGVVIMTTVPNYIFFSKDDVEMSVLDLPIISSESSKNIKMIPGKYSISKWARPVNFTFTVVDKTQPVKLTAEDPIFAVRFHTPDNIPVKMTRFELTQDTINNTFSMVNLKNYRQLLPLPKLYELAEGVMHALKRRY